MSNEQTSPSSVILSFLIGGLAGAALAVLFAPRAGKETRDMLGERIREGQKRGRDIKERAVGGARDLLDEAEGFVDSKRGSVSRKKQQVQAAVDAGRQAYRDETEKAGAAKS